MKLTRSVSYALGILLRVQSEATSEPMTAARIARGSKFPPRFLYRVLRRLVDAGLLSGVSGPGGGYRLARAPQKINLWDVIQAVEGPPEPSLLEPVNGRHRQATQRINTVLRRQHEATVKSLKRLTLAQLGKR